MHSCDVLIVGGGPAGSSCAARLVAAGMDVLLVDRAAFPRDKVCAGWITPAVVRALHLDLNDYARTHTLQAFTGFRTGLIEGRLRDTDFPEVVSYGIRRCEFDAYLLNRSGVRRIESRGVRDIRHDGAAWIVDDAIRARLLVGAGGHFCPVARMLNRDVPDGQIVAAQEIEFELPADQAARCPVSGSAPELFFWPDLTGYGWCVRKGAFLNVGAGRLAPASLPAAVRQLTDKLARRGGVLPGTPRWKGHAYLLNRSSRRRVYGTGVLLIGDAAGLALAPSGEGILTAIESGVLAADVIAAAGSDYAAARLSGYDRDVRNRFGRRAMPSPPPRPGWVTAAASSLMLGVPWVRRHVVLEDWFLHRRRPDLSLAFSARNPVRSPWRSQAPGASGSTRAYAGRGGDIAPRGE